MAQAIFPLEEIASILGDCETASFACCDYCFQTVIEDIWAGKPERIFYRALDESKLIVCEHCVPKHVSGE